MQRAWRVRGTAFLFRQREDRRIHRRYHAVFFFSVAEQEFFDPDAKIKPFSAERSHSVDLHKYDEAIGYLLDDFFSPVRRQHECGHATAVRIQLQQSRRNVAGLITEREHKNSLY